MSSILQEIESQIAGVKTAVMKQNVGTVREIGDGVAKVEGLTDAMYNEMLDFGDGVTGLVLNLEETEVGAIILGDYTGIKQGREVRTTGKVLQVPVGMGLLGRVVNTLGQPVDDKGPIQTDKTYPVEKIAPGIIRRKSVSQPVQTGIMAIDAMIPIGRGQRELIIGDRSTGKSTICIDTIISNARLNKAAQEAGDKSYRPLYSIYVAIGQKQSNVANVIRVLEESSALPYTIVVVASASDSATNQYLAPFAGCAMGEWFMDNGMDALIIYDDLFKHCELHRRDRYRVGDLRAADGVGVRLPVEARLEFHERGVAMRVRAFVARMEEPAPPVLVDASLTLRRPRFGLRLLEVQLPRPDAGLDVDVLGPRDGDSAKERGGDGDGEHQKAAHESSLP